MKKNLVLISFIIMIILNIFFTTSVYADNSSKGETVTIPSIFDNTTQEEFNPNGDISSDVGTYTTPFISRQ